MKCKKCGHWRIEIFYHERTKPHGKCVCRACGETWFIEKHNLFKEAQMKNNQTNRTQIPGVRMAEVFGFQVPTSDYYLHRGHAWAVLEDTGLVKVGMDDFSQKVLGPAEEVKMPPVGGVYYQDHICLALFRQGKKASYLAPVDGAIAAVNPQVLDNPRLIHDDPYGEGWLYKVEPTNLRRNLDNLFSGEGNVEWIFQESHRLMNFMETEVGVTVPDGGSFVDDVFGHYPQLGWRPLVQGFFLTTLSRGWQKRADNTGLAPGY
jgi:glycine cleavage system H lipoate-binding protein